MRYQFIRAADDLRQLILDRPAVPVAQLARLCGLTIQQVAGYRAAHTLKTRRQASRPTSPHAVTLIPQHLKAQLQAARRRTEGALKNSLTRALHANAMIAKTLEALDRQL